MKRILCFSLLIAIVLSGCSKRPTEVPQDTIKEKSESESSIITTSSSTTSSRISDVDGLETMLLVVPEGYTLPRIGMRLEELEICTADEFITAAQTGDFSDYAFLADQTDNPNRCYDLEGYLFPATYSVYIGETPDSIIRKMLDATEQHVTPELFDAIRSSGYTFEEILTIASIIEKEAFERNETPVPQEMPKISSVLHNRLENNIPLQCDVTINYVEGAIKPFIDGDLDRYNEHYNTYKTPALPAGPICNPGIDAIKAAVFPEDTDYFYFLTDDEKNFYYSATYEEHKVLVDKYL